MPRAFHACRIEPERRADRRLRARELRQYGVTDELDDPTLVTTGDVARCFLERSDDAQRGLFVLGGLAAALISFAPSVAGRWITKT